MFNAHINDESKLVLRFEFEYTFEEFKTALKAFAQAHRPCLELSESDYLKAFNAPLFINLPTLEDRITDNILGSISNSLCFGKDFPPVSDSIESVSGYYFYE